MLVVIKQFENSLCYGHFSLDSKAHSLTIISRTGLRRSFVYSKRDIKCCMIPIIFLFFLFGSFWFFSIILIGSKFSKIFPKVLNHELNELPLNIIGTVLVHRGSRRRRIVAGVLLVLFCGKLNSKNCQPQTKWAGWCFALVFCQCLCVCVRVFCA